MTKITQFFVMNGSYNIGIESPTTRPNSHQRALIFGSLAVLFLTIAITACATSSSNDQHWVTAWSTSPVDFQIDFPASPPSSRFANRTIRNIVHTSIGGSSVRLRLTNAYGAQPVTFNAVHVGIQQDGASLVPNSNNVVTFGGSTSITVREGARALSDPVSLTVESGQNLAVSLFSIENTGRPTAHVSSRLANYMSDAGNFAADEGANAFTSKLRSWNYLDGADVFTSKSVRGAIVALGDSITDSGLWTDVLAKRFQDSSSEVRMTVLNAGISGNRVLSSSPCFGINAQARLEQDIFSQTGVRAIILFEGTNDLGHPDGLSESTPDRIRPCVEAPQITAEEMIAGYKQIIAQAHARGLKIYGATITPYQGYSAWTETAEVKRKAINDWIKTSGAFDGVIDFSAALADPDNPSKLAPDYDSGDHLHPNDTGQEALGNAVDLALFSGIEQ